MEKVDWKGRAVLITGGRTGPMNRVANNALARKLLGWEPQVKFIDGLRRTINWYFATKDRNQVKAILDQRLTER